MNIHSKNKLSSCPGLTLVELTVVILIILGLLSFSTLSVEAYRDWGARRDIEESLRVIYVAQREYLADNPSSTLATVTPAVLAPYLSNTSVAVTDDGAGNIEFPVIEGLNGDALNINVGVSPPTAANADENYDIGGISN